MMIGSIYNFLAPLGSYRPYSNQTASVQTTKENCIEEEVSRKGRLYRTHDASIASGDRFSRSWLSGHAPARGRAPRPRARHAPAHPRAEAGGGSAPEREYAAAWAATWGSPLKGILSFTHSLLATDLVRWRLYLSGWKGRLTARCFWAAFMLADRAPWKRQWVSRLDRWRRVVVSEPGSSPPCASAQPTFQIFDSLMILATATHRHSLLEHVL
jgi:hypothetical protein